MGWLWWPPAADLPLADESAEAGADQAMHVQLIRAADLKPQPWKNGGGTTRLIAVEPCGAEDFDWRVSMARVETAGPFSSFQGIDRTLLVLEGELTLAFADGRRVVVDSAGPPLTFGGEEEAVAETPATAVVDLNLMVRRGGFTTGAERRSVTSAAAVVCQDVTFILCRTGGLSIACGAEAHELRPDDALRIDGARGAAARLRCDLFTDIVIVHINAVR
jgi:hypothetical protein